MALSRATYKNEGGGATLDVASVDVPSGCSLLALVIIRESSSGEEEATGVALDPAGDNVAFSLVDSVEFGSGRARVEAWELVDVGATTGTLTVRGTLDGGPSGWELVVLRYTGQDATTPFDNANTATGSGTSTGSGLAATGDESIDVVTFEGSTTSLAADDAPGDATELYNEAVETTAVDFGVAVRTAGTHGWTWGTSRGFTHLQIGVNEAADLKPADPTDFQEKVDGSDETTQGIQWTDNATDEDGYEIQRAPDVGGDPGTWSTLSTEAAGTEEYFDSTVAAETWYHYRIRATKSGNDGNWTNPLRIRTAPNRPANLTADTITETSFRATWTKVGSTTDSYLLLWRQDGQTNWNELGPFQDPVQQFTIEGLVAGTTYDVAVQAYDVDGGFSRLTDIIEVTTLSAGGAPDDVPYVIVL